MTTKRITAWVDRLTMFTGLAIGVLVFPSLALAAPDDGAAREMGSEAAEAEVFRIEFSESLPATIPADPRRALNYPFLIQGSGGLSSLHLHLVVDAESPGAMSAIVVAPDGATWALPPDALASRSSGKVDVWLDLLDDDSDFAREASGMPVGGAWTVQFYHERPRVEGTLLDLEIILETVPQEASQELAPDLAVDSPAEKEAGQLETKAFPLDAADAAQDGCGNGGCGCRMFVGETEWIPRGVLLGLVLGLLLILSLKGVGRNSAMRNNGSQR